MGVFERTKRRFVPWKLGALQRARAKRRAVMLAQIKRRIGWKQAP